MSWPERHWQRKHAKLVPGGLAINVDVLISLATNDVEVANVGKWDAVLRRKRKLPPQVQVVFYLQSSNLCLFYPQCRPNMFHLLSSPTGHELSIFIWIPQHTVGNLSLKVAGGKYDISLCKGRCRTYHNCNILCVYLFFDCIASWFIDYWMEGGKDNAKCLVLSSQSWLIHVSHFYGLMRDVFTHKITSLEQWNKQLVLQNRDDRNELDYDLTVGSDTVITPSYDPHCTNKDIKQVANRLQLFQQKSFSTITKDPEKLNE
jgi:hypothetical protein